ncbi:hypothetical protein BDR06DRAFT_974616 [Suillus hirtellus]|nr:hypothetical protein BDR06DRAFT_974616 [Suillus hirtellus]
MSKSSSCSDKGLKSDLGLSKYIRKRISIQVYYPVPRNFLTNAFGSSAILSSNFFLNLHSEDTGSSITKAPSQYSKSYGVPASLAAEPRMTPALFSPLQWTYSENTRWLMPGERRLAQAHLAEDAGEADQYSAKVSVFDQDGHERYRGSSLSFVKLFPILDRGALFHQKARWTDYDTREDYRLQARTLATALGPLPLPTCPARAPRSSGHGRLHQFPITHGNCREVFFHVFNDHRVLQFYSSIDLGG